MPAFTAQAPAPKAALVGLGRAALRACIALAARDGKSGPSLAKDATVSRADAMELILDLVGDAFPRLRS